jgi:aspartyl-tRNA(Asn)/glutamyl-tRNA(Gln) amidotransferase subunit A
MTAACAEDPADLGVLDAAGLLRAGELSALELTEACLSRIDSRNGGPPSFDGAPAAVNAWVRVYADQARAEAREADRRLAAERGDAPLLCGIPLGVKDLYAVAGRPLTASSRVLDDEPAPQDAAVVARLRRDGMVVLGHSHTHEFAAGGTTDQVGNPWDLSRSSGGSSGGSAAALAARMVPAALGSDTCGSLRIPSVCCGTSTIKPSHGQVSLEGVIPLAPSLDHPGPMARTVADAAALLSVMATVPATSAMMPPPAPLGQLPLRASQSTRPLEGRTIAVAGPGEDAPWDAAVANGFDAARRALASLGARVVAAPAWSVAWDDLSAVLLTEMWSYHRGFAAHRDLYRPSIAELVEAAEAFNDAGAYFSAQQRRSEATATCEAWFADNDVDLLLEPTLPTRPPPRGEGYQRGHAGGVGDPLISLTAQWDMTGMPVVSLPVTWGVGVSLVAPRGAEALAVQVGIDLQERGLGLPDWPDWPD